MTHWPPSNPEAWITNWMVAFAAKRDISLIGYERLIRYGLDKLAAGLNERELCKKLRSCLLNEQKHQHLADHPPEEHVMETYELEEGSETREQRDELSQHGWRRRIFAGANTAFERELAHLVGLNLPLAVIAIELKKPLASVKRSLKALANKAGYSPREHSNNFADLSDSMKRIMPSTTAGIIPPAEPMINFVSYGNGLLRFAVNREEETVARLAWQQKTLEEISREVKQPVATVELILRGLQSRVPR